MRTSRPAPLLLPRRQRGRPARRRNLRLHRPQDAQVRSRPGAAFQLTNIIRDVGEDARRGRIYLPQDELARFGVAGADLSDARYSDNFRKLMAFQVERAQATYRQAFAQLPATDRKAQRAGLIMSAIYRATLDEIVREDYRVLHQRISLPPLRKLWLAGKTWWLA
jgi:phytoene synthase